MEVKELNQLKVVLVKKKRTGAWLAQQLGVTPVTVSKWCSQTSQPSLPMLSKIAEILEVNVKDLLNDTK